MTKEIRSRGFTLVEVLVATTILATGLLAALTAFSMAGRVTGAANNDTAIAFLAHQKLAEIQLLGGEELPVGVSTGDFAPDFPQYGWEMTVSEPDELNVMQVSLVILAPEAGRTREIWFSTAVF